MSQLVSVIIPTYKRADMLCRAIDSALNQSYSNIEVIVVDDNNPNTDYRETTEKKVAAYKNDRRVKYIQHEKNRNGSAARNTGIKHSSGDYLCFLDDDDFFYRDKIEKQLQQLQLVDDTDACCCDYIKNSKPVIIEGKKDYSRDIFLLGNFPQTSGLLFTRKSIERLNGFDESYVRHQDLELLIRFFSEGYRMCKVDEILYERDVAENSNVPDGKQFEDVKVKFLTQFEKEIDRIESEEPGFKKKVFAIHYERLMKNYIKSFSLYDAGRLFMMAFLSSPVTFLKELGNEFVERFNQ